MHTSRGHLLAGLLARLCIWVNVVFVSDAAAADAGAGGATGF